MEKQPFINIGTPKACLFVCMSRKLLEALREYPFLYESVEEALISEKSGYYSIGIIVWYELLLKSKFLEKETLEKIDVDTRNEVAHDILKIRPTKKSYDQLLDKFKNEAEKQQLKEISEETDKYFSSLHSQWEDFQRSLRMTRVDPSDALRISE